MDEARRAELEQKVLLELDKLKEERGVNYAMLIGVAGYAAESMGFLARAYPGDEELAIRMSRSHAQLMALLCQVMDVSEKDVMADVDRIEAILDADEVIGRAKEASK